MKSYGHGRINLRLADAPSIAAWKYHLGKWNVGRVG